MIFFLHPWRNILGTRATKNERDVQSLDEKAFSAWCCVTFHLHSQMMSCAVVFMTSFLKTWGVDSPGIHLTEKMLSFEKYKP